MTSTLEQLTGRPGDARRPRGGDGTLRAMENLPLPPGRRGLPLFGETLSFLRDPREFGRQRNQRYGDVYRTHLFGRPAVVVCGPEAAQQVFASEHTIVTARWPYSTRQLLGPGAISVQTGAVHKDRRKLLQQAFSRTLLASYVPEMDRVARLHLERWAQPRDLVWAPLLSKFTFHLACSLLVGAEDELLDLERWFSAWLEGLFSVPVPLPWSRYGRALRARRQLIERIREVVRARRQGLDRHADARDALSVLARATDDSGNQLSEGELCDQVLTLLFAGHETSASAFTSFGLLMAQHPDVLERLRAEQDRVARSGPLTIEDLDAMPYLWQVLKEVLRVIPPVAGGFREVITPLEIGGYRVPAGWSLQYQIARTHQQASSFADPERFDPDRFGPERSEDKRTRFSWIPFGGGPRLCVGLEFARLEMMVLGALLVRDYEWTLAPGQDLTLRTMPTPRPRSGLLVRIGRRRSAPQG